VRATLTNFSKSKRLKQCNNLTRFENWQMSHVFTPQ
jgi:hypothetical protein